MFKLFNKAVKESISDWFCQFDHDDELIANSKSIDPILCLSDSTNAFNSKALAIELNYVPHRMNKIIKENQTPQSTIKIFNEGKPTVSISAKNLELNSKAIRLCK